MNSKIKYNFVVCLAMVLHFTSGVKGSNLTDYKITMDPDDRYNVTWSFTGYEPMDEVTFTMEVETTGWVGLGFSLQGSMAGADIVVAWVDVNGTAHLQDMMAHSNSVPEPDTSQDVTLVSAYQFDGKTTITFSRKLSTCDGNDNELKKDTTRLIYAYSFTNPSGNDLSASDYHGADKRGSKSVYLFDPLPPKERVPEDAIYLELTNDQYEVPSDETTYHCSFHAAPDVDRKHHLIGFEPVISSGNEGIVHHMLLYSCWNVTQAHIRGTNKSDGVCYSPEMPEFESACRTSVYAWAVGGGNYYFPERTGYPFGTGDLDSPEYFMLEIHYDNPAMKLGIVDSSGLRIVYTPKLRENDVGMLAAGTTFGVMVPPKANNFEITGYCHSSCTEKWIPEEGITLFSYLLHAHLLAVKIKAEVFRNGKLLEVLAVDNAYDFNFQENRLYHKSRKLYPGDTVKVTCTYNSLNRTAVTKGGFSSREEMCSGIFGYYPKQSLSLCGSMPSLFDDGDHGLYRNFGVKAKSQNLSTALPTIDVKSSLASIKWNEELISQAQDIVSESSHVNLCLRQTGEGIKDVLPRYTIDEYNSVPDGEEDNLACHQI